LQIYEQFSGTLVENHITKANVMSYIIYIHTTIYILTLNNTKQLHQASHITVHRIVCSPLN